MAVDSAVWAIGGETVELLNSGAKLELGFWEDIVVEDNDDTIAAELAQEAYRLTASTPLGRVF